MLLELVIDRGRLTVDHDHAAHRLAVGSDGTRHPVAKRGIQVAIEQIGGFHDVHVTVDESQSIFHFGDLL